MAGGVNLPRQLDPVKNLTETTRNSLEDGEKRALNDISDTEIKNAKDAIGTQEFVINGNKKDLNTIVKDIIISADGTKATLYGKPIARQSELGAAIQVYVIACNTGGIGSSLIDGKVGTKTIEGLITTKAGLGSNIDTNTTTVETPIETVDDKILDNLNVLKTANMYQYFGTDAPKYQDTYNVLDKNTGVIKGLYINPTSGMVTFPYESGYKKGQVVSINPDTFLNDNKTVNISKFVKEVKDCVRKNETKLYNEQRNAYLIEGIKNFKPTDFTDQIVQTYMMDKKIKFTVEVSTSDQDSLIVKDSLGGSRTVKAYMYDLPGKKEFDKNQFRINFTNYYKSQAEEYCKDKVNNSISTIDRMRVSDGKSATEKVSQYNELLKTVTGYKNSKFDTQKEEISEKKFLAEMDATIIALKEFLYKRGNLQSHTPDEFKNAKKDYDAKKDAYKKGSKNLGQESMKSYNKKIAELDGLISKLP